MQKTVQKIVEKIVGSKPSMLANRPQKTVGGNRPANRRDKTVERTVEPTVRLVIDLERGTVRTVKVKL
jgi:hypothetical protein